MTRALIRSLACALTLAVGLLSWPNVSIAKSKKTYTEPKTGMDFVWIPAGSFMMGCDPKSDTCSDSEQPQHKVTLDGFYMGKTEVTQAQWVAVTGSNPSKNKGLDLPVENVSWQQAKSFCEKVGARLPTEAEWEYAARAGSTGRTICGDDESCPGTIAWYEANSGEQTHPVAQKRPNAWGLYDMAGNVREWVADRYGKNYYSKSPEKNPKGPTSGAGKSTRGGSFATHVSFLRLSYRFLVNPSSVFDYVTGFRCVMSKWL